ncbi:MAG TPA: tRNA epoxyqueuosine(34) reductase QueG [Edaphobacter sp.]|nr:tRNA epoxyqueuosine(34) reductase QueG [Edaphobacter sp.]
MTEKEEIERRVSGPSAPLNEWIQSCAVDAGFDTAGITAVCGVESKSGGVDAARFQEWVDAGRAGEMEYLKRRNEQGVLLRSGIEVAMPWARSVVVCAVNYNADAPRSIDPAGHERGWIARYAWSGRITQNEAGETRLEPSDYHDEMLNRLRRVEAALRERYGCETKCYVDTGPLVERVSATKAGIGWVGKNTCILNQKLGSWLLLGVIVTSLEVDEENAFQVADRCGSCTRCIDACPTEALIAPRQMDASRCISYLTIEKKGTIGEEFRELMGRQVFGCDICQDVCPWNRKAPVAVKEGMLTRRELINPALEWLAKMDAAEFRRWFKGSPLERTRKKRLHRNVAIAMGNSGQTQFVPQLEEWSSGEDEVLAESAQWALQRIRTLADSD